MLQFDGSREEQTVDAVFFLKHSKYDDVEIRHALRGIARHAPWIRKVWVFGDRPAFLTDDTRYAEHLPHESIAWVGPYRTPVRNFFLMFYLIALTPEIDEEILWFCDDFILLRDLTPESARMVRHLQDLKDVKSRGRGLWKDSLWRTYDLLQRFGYQTLNYETHVPTYFRKRWILDAVRDFRDFITEDRWFGMLGPTAILNHAHKRHGFPVVKLADESSRAGFYGKPPTLDEVRDATGNRTFLSFDDDAFGEDLQRYLAGRFPTPCIYEREAVNSQTVVPPRHSPMPEWPAVILPDRSHFARLLNEQGLLGEGVEVGTLRGRFAATILQSWQGRTLHCVDPWREMLDDATYVDINNVVQAEHDHNLQEAQRRLEPFGARCQLHRSTSQEAALRFADGSLDFVYLDARHYRAALQEDLPRRCAPAAIWRGTIT